MASKIEQFRIWDTTRELSRKLQFSEAVELYRSIESDMMKINEWKAFGIKK